MQRCYSWKDERYNMLLQKSEDDEQKSRLIVTINQTNLVALDKTIQQIRRASKDKQFAGAAARCGSIGQRMVGALEETGAYCRRLDDEPSC